MLKQGITMNKIPLKFKKKDNEHDTTIQVAYILNIFKEFDYREDAYEKYTEYRILIQ